MGIRLCPWQGRKWVCYGIRRCIARPSMKLVPGMRAANRQPRREDLSMTVPVWTLLGFALWTIMLLLGTVGVYRWSRILTGRAAISDYREYRIEGKEWYKRALRAHANCVENLPVFGAIVLALHVSGIQQPPVNTIAVSVLLARIMQSLIHVGLSQTNPVVFLRFVFFFVQIIGFLWLSLIIMHHAWLAH